MGPPPTDWFTAFIQYDLREQANYEQHVMFKVAIRHKMYQLISKVSSSHSINLGISGLHFLVANLV